VTTILTLGDLNLDIVAFIGSYPAKGGDGLMESAEIHVGGSAANTAMALARLGLSTGFIGRVGQDVLAKKLLGEMETAGVDVRYVQTDPLAATGVVFIAVTPDGERTMFSSRGANVQTDPEMIVEGYFREASWLHLSGYSLLAEPQRSAAQRALLLARVFNCRVSLDVGMAAAKKCREELWGLLPQVNVLLLNQVELALLSDGGDDVASALDRFLEVGLEAVVLTRGRDGCLVATPDERFSMPGFSVAAQDSTGSGDSFSAGLIIGRQRGLDWRASAVLGCALGAFTVQLIGAAAEELEPAAVRTLLQRHLDDPRWQGREESIRQALEAVAADL
jgi:ribokinase